MALKSKARSGFVYKPRDTKQVKDRANRKAGLFDSIFKSGVDEYRPKTGDNAIRYLPPTWNDSDHYGYTAFVHNNIGPDNSTYLCPRKMLNKPCPVCEAQKEAKDAGEADEAKALGVSERVVSYVLDRDGDDPEKPLAYNQSWTQDRDVTALCVNERTGEILMIDHPDKGFDVIFKRQGTGLKTKYYGWQIDRQDSPIHDKQSVQDEILEYVASNPIPDLFNFYDYDYLKGVLSGKVAEKDADLEEEDESSDRRKPARTASRRPSDEDEDTPFDGGKTRGPRRDNDPGDVEEEEEDEAPPPRRSARKAVEEEEEAPPPRRATARRPEPKDEEVNEEEEEAPPPRSAARGRTRVVEEVEEEEAEDEAPPPRRSARR